MNFLRTFAALILIFVVVETIAISFQVPDYVYSPPSRSFLVVVERPGHFFDAWRFTTLNALMGLLGATAVASLFVLCAYINHFVRSAIVAVVDVAQSFPKESLFPIFVLWVGFGATPKVINALLLSFIPLFVNVFGGINNTRSDYVLFYRSIKPNNPVGELLHCRLPASVPSIYSGFRLALPLALVGSVLGEFLGGQKGLGRIIIDAGMAFRVDLAFGSIYLLALTGIILLGALDFLFRTCFKKYLLEGHTEIAAR